MLTTQQLDSAWSREWYNWSCPDDLKWILAPYDESGALGNTVADIGAGWSPISFSLRSPRRYLLVDVSNELLSLEIPPGICAIKINSNLDDLLQGNTLGSIEQYAPIGTFIDSNVLSFLDRWRSLLQHQARLHQRGGYLAIANILNYGHIPGITPLISNNAPKTHEEITREIWSNGYELIKSDMENELSIVLARKL